MKPLRITELRDAKTHLANARKMKKVVDQDRLAQSLAKQPPNETTPQEARQPEQVAFIDVASGSATVEQAQGQQDEMRHSEPGLSNPAPDAVRRFRAIDALHALRMR
jgi:hypothetical protein